MGKGEQIVSREEARGLEPACLSVRQWATSWTVLRVSGVVFLIS